MLFRSQSAIDKGARRDDFRTCMNGASDKLVIFRSDQHHIFILRIAQIAARFEYVVRYIAIFERASAHKLQTVGQRNFFQPFAPRKSLLFQAEQSFGKVYAYKRTATVKRVKISVAFSGTVTDVSSVHS